MFIKSVVRAEEMLIRRNSTHSPKDSGEVGGVILVKLISAAHRLTSPSF